MTITSGKSQTSATTHPMTLEEYLHYDDGTEIRYELVDGVLVEMGAESTLNTQIASFLFAIVLQLGFPPYLIGFKQKIAVKSTTTNAREPDLIVHSQASARAIDDSPQAILRLEHPVPLLVIEVVSPGKEGTENYDRDYIEKRREYALRGIPEYWIIDPDRHIILVLTLQGQAYQEQRFMGTESIISPTFPQLTLTAEQILTAGK